MTAPQHPVHWTLWYELRFYVLFGVVFACQARGLRPGAVALADRGRSLERPFYLLHEKLGSDTDQPVPQFVRRLRQFALAVVISLGLAWLLHIAAYSRGTSAVPLIKNGLSTSFAVVLRNGQPVVDGPAALSAVTGHQDAPS